MPVGCAYDDTLGKYRKIMMVRLLSTALNHHTLAQYCTTSPCPSTALRACRHPRSEPDKGLLGRRETGEGRRKG
eukprot:3065969-Rhodomonas_salina.1